MVLVSLESKQDCWFSTPGSHLKAAIPVLARAAILAQDLTGNDPLINSHDCWNHQSFSRIVSLRAAVPSPLSVGSYSQFLPCGPVHREAHNMVTCFLRASKEESLSVWWTLKSYVINWYTCNHIHSITYWSETNLRTHSHSKGENYTISWIPGGKSLWGHLIACLPQGCTKYPYWISKAVAIL